MQYSHLATTYSAIHALVVCDRIDALASIDRCGGDGNGGDDSGTSFTVS